MKTYFENEEGIVPFNMVVEVQIRTDGRKKYIAVFTNRHYNKNIENNNTYFNIEQLDDYKKWLERGNLAEITKSSNKIKLDKEDIQKLIEKQYLLSECESCQEYDCCYISNNAACNPCFKISLEFIEKINKALGEL